MTKKLNHEFKGAGKYCKHPIIIEGDVMSVCGLTVEEHEEAKPKKKATGQQEVIVEILTEHNPTPIYRDGVRGYQSDCTCGWTGPERTGHYKDARQSAVRDGYLHVYQKMKAALESN